MHICYGGLRKDNDTLKRLFRMIDNDQSGTITLEEFKKFFNNKALQKQFTENFYRLTVSNLTLN